MKAKILLSLVVPIVLLAILADGTLAAKKVRIPSVLPNVDGAGSGKGYGSRSPVMYEAFMQPDCEDIHPDLGMGYVIQHYQHGTTWYDYQQNGSMGRMISATWSGNRHMVFHRSDGEYSGTPGTRSVCYNCKDPFDVWCCGPECINWDENAGYANVDHLSTDEALIIYHRTAGSPTWYTTLAVQDIGFPCASDFTNIYDIPDVFNDPGATKQGMWPKMCVVRNVWGIDYMHIVMTEGKTESGDQRLGYVRCYLDGDNLICDTPIPNGQADGGFPVTLLPNEDGCAEWCKIAYWGECEASFCPTCVAGDYPNDISVVVVSSPVSRKVAIVFVNKKESGTSQVNNDVFYFESDSNGYEWFPQYGGTWPPTVANLMLTNVTLYPDSYTERAYTDLAACYDYEDHLHIVWNSCEFNPATGLPASFNANLMHWVNTDPPGIDNASVVAPGYWDDGTYDCGAWNRNISKMSISCKPPEYHPDSVFLFCTWTQFGPKDVSAKDFANGDIYAAVSADGGQTWTRGLNLTGTNTDGCDLNAEDPCLSEHWSSLAEYMYLGDMHIQYICDRDAGGAILDAPSEWTENPVMYLHFQQPPTDLRCGVDIKLTDPPGGHNAWHYPPLKVLPNTSRTISMTLEGLYTLAGGYWVTTNDPNVVCINNCDGTLYPQEEVTVGLQINCSGGESFLRAKIFIDYCIGTEEEGRDTIDLHVVQSNDYYECPRDPATWIEKDNGWLKAKFWVNTEERVWDKRVLDPDGDEIQPIFSAGPIVATSWQGDTVVGRQDYRDILTGARDTITVVEVVDGECLIQRLHVKNTYICAWPLPIPVHQRWWWIDIHKQIFMFHGPDCPEWKKEQIIKQIWITRSQPPAWWPSPGAMEYEDIYFGYFADVDAPFDTGCNGCNAVGYDETHQMVWFHGYNAVTHPEYEQYYVGLTFTDRDGNVVPPLGVQVVRNDSFLYPNNGWGWKNGQLYDLAATPGVNIQDPGIDTLDRSVVMTADMIPGGTGNFSSEFILIEAFTPTGFDHLVTHMEITQEILIPHLDSLGLFDGDTLVVKPTDLVFVMDGSGSIAQTDFQLQKDGYAESVKDNSCLPHTGRNSGRIRVGVVQFSSYGRIELPMTPITSSNANSIANIIESITQMAGGTNYEDGIAKACTLIVGSTVPIRAIIFSTDGDPNLGNTDPVFLRNKAQECGFTELDAIGVGPGVQMWVLDSLVFPQPPDDYPGISDSVANFLEFSQVICGVIQQVWAGPSADCSLCFSDSFLITCPLGDIPFNVFIRDSSGNPVVGYSNVRLDFSDCNGIIPCPVETFWPIVYPDAPSDADGVVPFHVHAGGCDNACSVLVQAGCGLIGYVPVKTVDIDGDLVVRTNDWHHIGVDTCNDYNWNGEVNFWDLDFFRDHITHSCIIDPCLSLSQDLTVSPDTLLPPESTHKVRLFIKNNHTAPCSLRYVEFYRAGFGQGPSLVWFATRDLWQRLMPGDTIVTEADFVVPGTGSGYILSKLYANCCVHSIDATFNFTVRVCPPDSMVYVFPLNLSFVPAYVETLEYMPETPGWYWTIYYTGWTPDSVAIVTPDTSMLGLTGSVTLFFFDQNSNLLGYRTCEVRITLNSGDANSDCVVNSADIVYLINYLFKSGPPPNPIRAGDINCDCVINSADIVYLINYLFKGGPPPVSSETCECGY